jgi:hypothetical protein
MKTPSKHILLGLCLLFIFALSACKKDITLPDPSLRMLFGEWRWISSQGGFTGAVSTPATCGCSETIKFTAKGDYYHYYSDNKETHFRYSVADQPYSPGLPNYVLHYLPTNVVFPEKTEPSNVVSFIGPDTLVLDWYQGESYVNKYVRVK